jgi:hypothetical protein
MEPIQDIDLSEKACLHCGIHHLLDEFTYGMLVDTPDGLGEVVYWSQYSTPVYVRVQFENSRENYSPCQLKRRRKGL